VVSCRCVKAENRVLRNGAHVREKEKEHLVTEREVVEGKGGQGRIERYEGGLLMTT